MKQECQRCDKEIEVKNIPKMFCPKCVDEIIDFNRKEAKREVFDDINKFLNKYDFWMTGWMTGSRTDIEYNKLKERHLSTFQKKSDIIADKSKSANE